MFLYPLRRICYAGLVRRLQVNAGIIATRSAAIWSAGVLSDVR
jgi:hypothetical protein